MKMNKGIFIITGILGFLKVLIIMGLILEFILYPQDLVNHIMNLTIYRVMIAFVLITTFFKINVE